MSKIIIVSINKRKDYIEYDDDDGRLIGRLGRSIFP